MRSEIDILFYMFCFIVIIMFVVCVCCCQSAPLSAYCALFGMFLKGTASPITVVNKRLVCQISDTLFSPDQDHCHYKGYMEDMEDTYAAFSLCSGLKYSDIFSDK